VRLYMGLRKYSKFIINAFKNGQSIGKRLMKIQVVDATSRKPCTLIKAFLRHLPSIPLGVFDYLFVFSKKRQRLGDTLANTIVVKCDRSSHRVR
jgi:uncharacterized RDD family membrane protein YckC